MHKLMLRGNKDYVEAFACGKYRFYVPLNSADPQTGYQTVRMVEATNQQIYANSGGNAEVWQHLFTEILKRVDGTMATETRLSDIAVLCNNGLYRLKYPVDEHCAMRMGVILTFMEYENEQGQTITEDPARISGGWRAQKEQLAFEHPDLYAFFLTVGSESLPQYRNHLDGLTEQDYFSKRMETIRALLPIQIP